MAGVQATRVAIDAEDPFTPRHGTFLGLGYLGHRQAGHRQA